MTALVRLAHEAATGNGFAIPAWAYKKTAQILCPLLLTHLPVILSYAPLALERCEC